MNLNLIFSKQGVEAAQTGDFGIEVGDGVLGVLVGLQQQAVGRAGQKGLGVEAWAKTEIESPFPRSPRGEEGLFRQFKELPQLLGIAPIAMPNPGLAGTKFLGYVKDVVDGADAVEEERQVPFLAQPDFLAKDP